MILEEVGMLRQISVRIQNMKLHANPSFGTNTLRKPLIRHYVFELGHCCMLRFTPNIPKVTDEGLACLRHIRTVSISNLSPETGCSE
jgi:hypothetical protein